MVLENVSLSTLTWIIVITFLLIVLGSVLLTRTRFRRFRILPLSEIRFVVRLSRSIGLVLFIVILMELVSGVIFGKGFIDTTSATMTWYINKAVFLAATVLLTFAPKYVFSFTKAKELTTTKDGIKLGAASSTKVIDSTDWDILNAIKKHGGDLDNLKNQLRWISEDELENRISKLSMLNYIQIGSYEMYLTPEALDVINLPPMLFASTINDKTIIKKLAEIKIGLKKEDANGVIIESCKLLEWILRQRLEKKFPEMTKIRSGKPLEFATLGDLIGDVREHKLVSIFEDNILTAINDIRKAVHSKDGKMAAVSLEKAYFAHTLTEIAVRSLCNEEN